MDEVSPNSPYDPISFYIKFRGPIPNPIFPKIPSQDWGFQEPHAVCPTLSGCHSCSGRACHTLPVGHTLNSQLPRPLENTGSMKYLPSLPSRVQREELPLTEQDSRLSEVKTDSRFKVARTLGALWKGSISISLGISVHLLPSSFSLPYVSVVPLSEFYVKGTFYS